MPAILQSPFCACILTHLLRTSVVMKGTNEVPKHQITAAGYCFLSLLLLCKFVVTITFCVAGYKCKKRARCQLNRFQVWHHIHWCSCFFFSLVSSWWKLIICYIRAHVQVAIKFPQLAVDGKIAGYYSKYTI